MLSLYFFPRHCLWLVSYSFFRCCCLCAISFRFDAGRYYKKANKNQKQNSLLSPLANCMHKGNWWIRPQSSFEWSDCIVSKNGRHSERCRWSQYWDWDQDHGKTIWEDTRNNFYSFGKRVSEYSCLGKCGACRQRGLHFHFTMHNPWILSQCPAFARCNNHVRAWWTGRGCSSVAAKSHLTRHGRLRFISTTGERVLKLSFQPTLLLTCVATQFSCLREIWCGTGKRENSACLNRNSFGRSGVSRQLFTSTFLENIFWVFSSPSIVVSNYHFSLPLSGSSTPRRSLTIWLISVTGLRYFYLRFITTVVQPSICL